MGVWWNMRADRRTLGRAALAVLLLALAGGAAGWVFLLRPVSVALLAPREGVTVQVFGLGTVEARVSSRLGFKLAGVLGELRVDVGDRVPAGTLLARLDDREQAARLARARAAVAQAEAGVARASAVVTRTDAVEANAARTDARRQALLPGRDVSAEAADTARAALQIARADGAVAHADLAVARAAADDARANAELEAVTLDLHRLAAPFDGLVTARSREPGTALAAGEPVLTLVDPATIWVLAYIDESRSGAVRVGQPAQIVLRSAPGHPLPGHVARIEIESDRVNEERRIQVAFDRIPADPHLGEQAEVTITTATVPRGVFVPEAAFDGLRAGHGTVWTLEDGRLARREVSLGAHLLDGSFQVTGLPAGARVLATLPARRWVGRPARAAP